MSVQVPDKLSFAGIFRAYGGWRSLLSSGYFWFAVILLLPTWSQWSNSEWWTIVFDVIPSMLGFTLGGFALMLAFGDERFRALLAKTESRDRPCVITEMAATFWVFIAVQVLSLLSAIVFKALWDSELQPLGERITDYLVWIGPLMWGISYFLFLYSLVLTIAASHWIYMLAVAYADHLRISED